MTFFTINLSSDKKNFFFTRLENIYAEMEKRYEIVAGAIDFNCNNCLENCCYTHFQHHTLIEYLYLMEGLMSIDNKARKEIDEKAVEVAAATKRADNAGEKIRIMCPVNKNGRCTLYSNRLMICRLHGTAHYFDTPKGRMAGPGCYRFEKLSKGKKSVPMLDRTDMYRELAFLEMDVRKYTGFNDKFKYSIAEMISASL
ncbi:MAG: hypothetical protein CSA18_00290 [Deltaproteobacteria bacterium]|nr:MAG: hypothetical protein CSA18_00290 [Deltaproteobacteria bacterium]